MLINFLSSDPMKASCSTFDIQCRFRASMLRKLTFCRFLTDFVLFGRLRIYKMQLQIMAVFSYSLLLHRITTNSLGFVDKFTSN